MHPPLAFVGFDDGAELGLVVVAMFAILILAGLWLIATFAGGVMRRVPVVGPPVAGAFDAAARGLRSAISATLHGTLWAAGKVFHAVAAFAQNIVAVVRDTLDAVGGALEHTVNVIIPREITGVRTFALRQANNALVTALQYGRSVRQDAYKWYLDAKAYAAGQAGAVRTDLTQALTGAYTDLRSRITTLAGQAHGWVDAAIARADRQFAQAEADAAALARQAQAGAVAIAQAAADGQARDAWAPLWAGIAAAVAGAIQVAGSDFPAITRQLQAIPVEAPATLAEAEIAAAAAIPPMMTALEECVLPGCRDLSAVRQQMHAWATVLLQAAFLAWIIQMITDPAGWARETYDVLAPVIDAEVAAVRALGGL